VSRRHGCRATDKKHHTYENRSVVYLNVHDGAIKNFAEGLHQHLTENYASAKYRSPFHKGYVGSNVP
jgi:hypothetical protein